VPIKPLAHCLADQHISGFPCLSGNSIQLLEIPFGSPAAARLNEESPLHWRRAAPLRARQRASVFGSLLRLSAP